MTDQVTASSRESVREFRSIPLRLVNPEYDSELTDLIIRLEYLRNIKLAGTTPPHIFFQIKNIFHIFESVGSARIEGNRTTVIEYIDQKLEKTNPPTEGVLEIMNMEGALRFIEDNISNNSINRAFISELHKIVVNGLTEEGSRRPGEYRDCTVKIRNSELVPCPAALVPSLMDELLTFSAQMTPPRYSFLKIAFAHHRFSWIHPFDNGNGRIARLFTYAMMLKGGFNVHLWRIINPTAVFCNNREQYYSSLAAADSGEDAPLLQWASYMLFGLKIELEKTNKLADYDYLKSQILLPAINVSLGSNIINQTESQVLRLAIEKITIANSDIRALFPHMHITNVSKLIHAMTTKNFLVPSAANQRKYSINFHDNKLISGILSLLDKEGFLPSNQ